MVPRRGALTFCKFYSPVRGERPADVVNRNYDESKMGQVEDLPMWLTHCAEHAEGMLRTV